jgi:HTH-type transcriptional regulator/antitoxin HigA
MIPSSAIYVDPPGIFIEEELEARGWSKSDLAYALDMSLQQLSPILSGKQGISPAMARSLGEVFDVAPEFFANLNSMFQLSKTPVADPGVAKRARWLDAFPVREMISRGWIEDGDATLLDLQMLRFFEKTSTDEIPFIGSGDIDAHAARKQGYDEGLTSVQYAWLQRVKQVAREIDAPAFEPQALRDSLPELRAHMQSKDDLQDIPLILRDCGVRLVFVESLPRGKIDGICAWLGDQPVIGLTLSRDRLDNFCFVLRHEIEHVLNGDGLEATYMPPDELTREFLQGDGLPPEEIMANEAAAEFLVPQQQLRSFMARKGKFISEKDVIAFAARLQINVSVVVGQIQFQRNRYDWLRKHQKSMRDYVMAWEFTDGWKHPYPVTL